MPTREYPIATVNIQVGIVAPLREWSSMAKGAFAANTIRAWKADWGIFTEFCRTFRVVPLPAAAQTVRDFVFECVAKEKKPATIRRCVSTIGRAHRAANLADPTATEAVKLGLKAMSRSVPARQRQARGLVWKEIEIFLGFEPRNLRDIRDRALVTVAYDTMCRREELVSLRIEDIEQAGDGSGSVLIRRSKTDTAGEGATAYLSPLTMRLVAAWLQAAMLKSGPIFVRVVGKSLIAPSAPGKGQRTQVREASRSRAFDSPSPGEDRTSEQPGETENMTAQIVTAVLRKVGQWVGLPREEWERISGHSCRVGAAQDLLALKIDMASVMQAGRWKDTRMPMRYGEKVLASRGGMARAAKEQGRT